MEYIEAPNVADVRLALKNAIFLAGSITGAEDWQLRAKEKLLPYFNVFNPRRSNYIWSETEEKAQIQWEHLYIDLCPEIVFYFSWETFAPITLFELGKVLRDTKIRPHKKVYICIHPDYKRKNDVIIQTTLENPKISQDIRFDLDETLSLIINRRNE